jgi:DNA-binding MurR/RpiR family transcriptional regulator
MKVEERVKNNALPIKQLRVIEAILDDLESNSFLSGNELCKKFDISFSSLTRLAKSLQYNGFPELKKDIEKMYKTEFSPSQQAETFVQDTRDKSILNIVFQSEIRNLNKLTGQLHEVDLIECAKKINNSSRVFVIGVGQMAFVATKFSESLKILSKNVICLTELGFSKQAEMYSITDKDIVVAFSINKELIEYQDIFTSLQSKKIFSILFTDKKTGRLRKLTSHSFYASSTGHGMINCVTPFIVASNILESILFSMDKHVHLAKIRNIEKKWNSLPIFLN